MFYVIIATLCRSHYTYTSTTTTTTTTTIDPKAYPKAITIPYIACTFTI